MLVIYTQRDLNYSAKNKKLEDVTVFDLANTRVPFEYARTVVFIRGEVFRVLKAPFKTDLYEKHHILYLSAFIQKNIEKEI